VAGLVRVRWGTVPLHECTTAAWRKLMVFMRPGLLRLSRSDPLLDVRKRGGTILNTSSVLAHFPERNRFATVAYAASKER